MWKCRILDLSPVSWHRTAEYLAERCDVVVLPFGMQCREVKQASGHEGSLGLDAQRLIT